MDALWAALPEEEQLNRLRERWGDLPQQELLERELLAHKSNVEPYTIKIAPRNFWPSDIHIPEFATWFVKELLQRPWQEVDAYLTLGWRIGKVHEQPQPGEQRRIFSLEQVPYLRKLLKAAMIESTLTEQHILKQARKWFGNYLPKPTSRIITSVHKPTSSSVAPQLSLPQIALIHVYEGWIITKKEAGNIVRQYSDHTSGDKLYILFCQFSRSSNERTGFDGRSAIRMAKSIRGIFSTLSDEARQRAEREVGILEARK